MTARPDRRRRVTVVGAVVALVLVLTAGGLAALGAVTVIDSEAGETVAADDRPVVALPSTDNAALAVVDVDGRLTSLIVATVLPSGRGGSIVTVPVDADARGGFGDERIPLEDVLDLDDPASFFVDVESSLAVSLAYGEVVSADRLAALLEPVVPVPVDLAVDIVDDDDAGRVPIVRAGESLLSSALTVDVLRASDDQADALDQHADDVAVWSALAAQAPAGVVEVPTDEFDRPVPAASVDEVFARLWSGEVQVRDLALDASTPTRGADVVVLDRRDVLLVFAQVSPAQVSNANPGPVFRVEIPMTDEQITSTGQFPDRIEAARLMMGELLFLQANVASVDSTPDPDGAPSVTRIEVTDPSLIESMERLGELAFGEAEVVVADEVIDGVDVVLRVGTGWLEVKAANAAATVDTDGDTDG